MLNLAAYLFVPIDDPHALAAHLERSAGEAGLKGTILVAGEGINLFLAGPDAALRVFVDELRAALCAVDGVTEVHDLHVWTLVPGKDMVTAHLTSVRDSAAVLDDARAVLTARGLGHATVQVEPPDSAADCECESQA